MKTRGLLALGLLLVAAFVDRAGYYGARMILALQLHARGDTAAELGMAMGVGQAIFVAGTVTGGLLALRLGPRLGAALALLAGGIGQLAVAAGAPLLAGSGVASFGAGMFVPCLFGSAAPVLAWDDESPDAPGPHRFAGMAAFAAASYGATTLAGMFGAPLISALYAARPGLVPVVCGVLGLVAAALAGGAVLLGIAGQGPARGATDAGPYRAAPPPGPPPAPVSATLGGLGILAAIQVVLVAGLSMSHLPPDSVSRSGIGLWVRSLQSIVGLVASIAVAALLLLALVRRSSLPPLYLHGAGLLAVGLGLGVIGVADASVALFAVGAALTGIGAVASYAVPIAYAAVAVRGRAAALVVAGWVVVVTVASNLSTGLGSFPGMRTVMTLVPAVICLAAGAAILATARRLHQAFFASPGAPG